MLCIFDGVINNPKVTNKIIPNIEHGVLPKVKALVLHRTSAGTAESTLHAWQSKKSGAHFLIDKTGKIYQTTSLKKQCWHVGLLQSRCRLEGSCSTEDAKFIKKTLHGSGSWGSKFKKVYLNEKKKNYPDRYPLNSDSLGIELVGSYLGGSGDKGPFEKLKEPQGKSFLGLVTERLSQYDLSFKEDVYAHGSIARKKVKEGVDAFEWLKDNYQ